MDWFDACIHGLLQGLTEYLPVSSSGHLEIGKALLGLPDDVGLTFTVIVHGATVMSIVIVFAREIGKLVKDFLGFKWDESNKYLVKIIVSMLPVIVVGLFFKDYIEGFFASNLVFVGSMLIVTAVILAFTFFAKEKNKKISFMDALIIGIAQAVAVLPGISRSGATIATGILLGNKKEETAKFSFLMVLLPVIGANVMDVIDSMPITNSKSSDIMPLLIGFFVAFITGLIACKWMLFIVKRGKLIYFSVYCLIIGLLAIILS